MDSKNNTYRISFFRPTNEYTKANRNLVFSLVLIWAVAVFGFHILLRVIEKPVKEPALIEYEAVKTKVFNNNATIEEKQQFTGAVISVLGKAYLRDPKLKKINKNYQEILSNTLGWSAYSLLSENKKSEFKTKLDAYNLSKIQLEKSEVSEKIFFEKKNIFLNFMKSNFDVIIPKGEMASVKRSIFITMIQGKTLSNLPQEYQIEMDKIMDLYLTHNQSVLTDTKFLGFPFHYFYSAVFLLMLFVVLCWVYAYKTEVLNKKFAVEE